MPQYLPHIHKIFKLIKAYKKELEAELIKKPHNGKKIPTKQKKYVVNNLRRVEN
ncbi:MAG TPA: hypothetical protein ACFYD6_12985 [Candidatus Brocadiia bacterium]|nr:hypothetical protein [Candidatus Brocadiales bacterium]